MAEKCQFREWYYEPPCDLSPDAAVHNEHSNASGYCGTLARHPYVAPASAETERCPVRYGDFHNYSPDVLRERDPRPQCELPITHEGKCGPAPAPQPAQEGERPLPCPFCGGTNARVCDHDPTFVRCYDCHADGPTTLYDPVENWNTRRYDPCDECAPSVATMTPNMLSRTPAPAASTSDYSDGFKDARRLAVEHFAGHECEPDCLYKGEPR